MATRREPCYHGTYLEVRELLLSHIRVEYDYLVFARHAKIPCILAEDRSCVSTVCEGM